LSTSFVLGLSITEFKGIEMKQLGYFTVVLLMLGVVVGCGSTDTKAKAPTNPAPAPQAPPPTTQAEPISP
jgi:hypothetical protein